MTSHQAALSDTRLGGRGHYNIFVQCAISPDHLCASGHIRGYCDIVETLCGTLGNPEKLTCNRYGGPRQELLSLWPERTKAPYEIRLGALIARDAMGMTVPTAR
jgi:hypothetical protein